MRARPSRAGDIEARTYALNNASGAEREKLLAQGGDNGATSHWEPMPRSPPGITRGELMALGVVMFIAMFVRFWRLDRPSSVVFDEVHFGGFAAKYIKRKFFMDVHPPLAKLLITFAAWVHGFKGNFNFNEIGREYLVTPDSEKVPYVAMRMVGATFGFFTIPLAYFTLRGLHLRPASALLGCVLVAFENALTTQSRLILLDAPLIFFVAAALCAWVNFCNVDAQAPFTRYWWLLLAATGASLGAVVSCKWVGLFTIAAIGLAVAFQLWNHLGNTRIPIRTLGTHLMARAGCLLGIPLVVYMLTFVVHFAILTKAGSGDTFMSWPFRHTLDGHKTPATYADVALGSKVRIQHYNTLGGYLHSHAHALQTGSKQQQVTLYPFRDHNNEWLVLLAPKEKDLAKDKHKHAIAPEDEVSRFMHNVTYLQDKTRIRLMHDQTRVRLHSHNNHRPPVSESDYQNEVSGYGFPDQKFGGDVNDDWIVEIERQEHTIPPGSSKRVIALRTVFRLRHAHLGCYLYSHKVALPEWGFGQQEVTCNGSPTLPNSLWYIETNTHPKLVENPKAPKVNYVLPTFLQKFLELNRAMWNVNKQLTNHHVYESRPSTWPVLRRGINFWTKHHRQVYLFGNIFTWGLGTLSVVIYALARILLVLRAQRGYHDFSNSTVVFYDRVCGLLAVMWGMHYLPFWLMSRQLFIHHYLPALYMSILLSAAIFDLVTGRLRPRVRLQAALFVAICAILVFWRYSPIVYASRWTGDGCQSSIYVKSWDFNCVDFPDDIQVYDTYDSVVQHPNGTEAHAWLPKVSDMFHRIAFPAPNAASQSTVASASGHQAFDLDAKPADLNASSISVSHVPNLSGLDQAQRQQAVLQGTQSIASNRESTSISSQVPEKV
ncbi:dolichyl-phosphate-mannose--protein mannosyltransferase [Malassezia yamatoensis]|uniref:Dolichyl-phosphate-mannose--protein mannosyltransferase n=1 Tax=Malassezia yamatoensis TaxID=253288 RepID=A0AAJ6CGU2_9BASI|nr:dolichyl-phosphate-mannose--protein mannosyltransferase [Malassezia yamatoensis]